MTNPTSNMGDNRTITYISAVVLALMLITTTFTGCSSYSQSSGIQSDEIQKDLPSNVPKKVIVVPFVGDVRVTRLVIGLLSEGLAPLGFDLIDNRLLESDPVLSRYLPIAYANEEIRSALLEQFGSHGIFTGKVTSKAGIYRIRTFVDIKLVDAETGNLIWSVQTQDPRWYSFDTDVRSSVRCTVRHALKMFENDLKKSIKAEQKATRATSQ